MTSYEKKHKYDGNKVTFSCGKVEATVDEDVFRSMLETRPNVTAFPARNCIYIKLWDIETKKFIGYLHRIVMAAKKGDVVDHIDGNGLNNCRDNLRIVGMRENGHNRLVRRSKSGFVGVHRNSHSERDRFCGIIQQVTDHKMYCTNNYDTAVEAACARDCLYDAVIGTHLDEVGRNYPTIKSRKKALKSVGSQGSFLNHKVISIYHKERDKHGESI